MRMPTAGLVDSVVCVMGPLGAPLMDVAEGFFEAASNQDQNDSSYLISPSQFSQLGVPDDVAWSATLAKLRKTVVSGLSKSMRDHKSMHTTIIYHPFYDLKQRREVREICLDYGRPMVAVFVEASLEDTERYAMLNEIPEDSAIKLYRKMVRPAPVEGWSKIYRYNDKGVSEIWDRVTGKKSDKLLW